jgi:hypothetical protein
MSDELAPKPAGPVAVATQDQRNALRMIPPDWRKPVAFFWMCNAHLLPTALPVCARLKVWIADGLSLEDGKNIFRALVSPERAAEHRFAADLLAELANRVAEVMRQRRVRDEMQKRREAARPNEVSGLVNGLADQFGM